MKTYVIDVETTIRCPTHGSSPFATENELVLLGVQELVETEAYLPITRRHPLHSEILSLLPNMDKSILVGHNIGYDLKWLWRALKSGTPTGEATRPLLPAAIWDTQQVEYLLSGQRHMFPALDDVCAEYGLPLKDKRISDYWAAGVDTVAIPAHELDDYLLGDLSNTARLYQIQKSILSHPSLEKLKELVEIKMEDILYTTMMEWFGMSFDLTLADTEATRLFEELDAVTGHANALCRARINGLSSDDGTDPSKWEFQISSTKDMGTILFGGEVSYRQLVEAGVYKTGPRKGEPKFKYETRTVEIPPAGGTKPHMVMGKKLPKVDDEVLSAIAADKSCHVWVKSLCTNLLQIRQLEKEITTYLVGYSKMMTSDGKIHSSINHCSTGTGRQSCTKPNLQNVSGVEE